MAREMKARPTYAVASVDHALHIATMLQLEGRLTVSETAERLGIARSTAHRLLSMLVYRDFAVQDESRVYHAGPVLELAAHSPSEVSRLRAAALPHLHHVVDLHGESVNLITRSGDTARFVASVEGEHPLRIGTREGMVFPVHQVSGGLVLLADLSDAELDDLYAPERFRDRPADRPDLEALRGDLIHVRRQGFAVNDGRSERGVVAIGRPVHRADGSVAAGVALSMPGTRYDPRRLEAYVATLGHAVAAIEASLSEPEPGIS